jgi:hypothetical protein
VFVTDDRVRHPFGRPTLRLPAHNLPETFAAFIRTVGDLKNAGDMPYRKKKRTAPRISNRLNNELGVTVKVLLTLTLMLIIATLLSQCDYGI